MINVGILGFGYMGEIRKKFLDKDCDFSVKAIFHNEKIEGDFDYYDDWKEVVKRDDLDVIFVCLPNYLIKDAVIYSLQNGKHVFAEKPPGISVEEVKEMEKHSLISNKKIKFGFNHRYQPAIVKLKNIVDSKVYGEMLWCRGRYGKSVDDSFLNSWRSDKKYSGGGIVIDQGIHILDIFLYLFGNFDEVKSFLTNTFWKKNIEDNAFIMMKNKKDQVVSVHSTMIDWRYLFTIEVFFEDGYVTVNGLQTKTGRYGKQILSYSDNKYKICKKDYSNMEIIEYGEVDKSWMFEIDEFKDSIVNDSPIDIGNVSDALNIMTLLEKIYN